MTARTARKVLLHTAEEGCRYRLSQYGRALRAADRALQRSVRGEAQRHAAQQFTPGQIAYQRQALAKADAEGKAGDVDGATFDREFLAETVAMARARGIPDA